MIRKSIICFAALFLTINSVFMSLGAFAGNATFSQETTTSQKIQIKGLVVDKNDSKKIIEVPLSKIKVLSDNGASFADENGYIHVPMDSEITIEADNKQIQVVSKNGDSNTYTLRIGKETKEVLWKNLAITNAYYYLQQGVDYFEKIGAPKLQEKIITTVNSGLTQVAYGACGSFFNAKNFQLELSNGACGNHALSPEIILHELTHAYSYVLGGLKNIPNSQTGAMSEAISDYFATEKSVFGKEHLETARQIKNNYTKQLNWTGDIHYDSQIISGALFKIKEILGKKTTDERVIKALPYAQKIESFLIGLLLADDDNGDFSDFTPNFQTIFEAFQKHGIAPSLGEFLKTTVSEPKIKVSECKGDECIMNVGPSLSGMRISAIRYTGGIYSVDATFTSIPAGAISIFIVSGAIGDTLVGTSSISAPGAPGTVTTSFAESAVAPTDDLKVTVTIGTDSLDFSNGIGASSNLLMGLRATNATWSFCDGDGTIYYTVNGSTVCPTVAGDADLDGITDTTEGTTDPDGDGIPNYRDTDSDGDGIPDSVEGNVDSDGDVTPDYLDLDSDADGIPDSIEGTGDSDGDLIPDYLDTDADNDGVADGVDNCRDVSNPGQQDTNGNGTGDACERGSALSGLIAIMHADIAGTGEDVDPESIIAPAPQQQDEAQVSIQTLPGTDKPPIKQPPVDNPPFEQECKLPPGITVPMCTPGQPHPIIPNVFCTPECVWSFGPIVLQNGSSATLADQTTGMEFGDAPDPGFSSRNANNGVRHINPYEFNFGANASTETDSRQVDIDTFDDMWGAGQQAPQLKSCEENTVTFTVKSNGEPMYLNALIDNNNNGKWDDNISDCGNYRVSEWAIQNQGIKLPKGIQKYTAKIRVGSVRENTWARWTLSEKPIAGNRSVINNNMFYWKGDRIQAFEFGETEDYLHKIIQTEEISKVDIHTRITVELFCNDNTDNDFDGFNDCNDSDCFGSVFCPIDTEICNDKIDNDNNGKIDCEDDACDQNDSCTEKAEAAKGTTGGGGDDKGIKHGVAVEEGGQTHVFGGLLGFSASDKKAQAEINKILDTIVIHRVHNAAGEYDTDTSMVSFAQNNIIFANQESGFLKFLKENALEIILFILFTFSLTLSIQKLTPNIRSVFQKKHE